MTARNSVRIVDHGANSLLKRLEEKGTVKVGVLAESGDKSHSSTGTTVSLVAGVHEFGAPDRGIPERSFIRGYVDENERDIREKIRKSTRQVIQGKKKVGDVLEILGLVFVGEIQERISTGIEPPLNRKTVERKGSSKPLIDTGQLRSSILHEVEVSRG